MSLLDMLGYVRFPIRKEVMIKGTIEEFGALFGKEGTTAAKLAIFEENRTLEIDGHVIHKIKQLVF